MEESSVGSRSNPGPSTLATLLRTFGAQFVPIGQSGCRVLGVRTEDAAYRSGGAHLALKGREKRRANAPSFADVEGPGIAANAAVTQGRGKSALRFCRMTGWW